MSLRFRMDVRTTQDYETDLRQYTEIERHVGIALREDFNERGMSCVLGEYGVDNSGDVIEGNLKNFNPDKIFYFKDRPPEKIEIKSLPEYCSMYFTFKVSSLKGSLYHEAKIVVPRRKDYFILGTKSFEWMLENLEARTDYRGWGGKRCVRIRMGAVLSLVREGSIINVRWKQRAADYIEKMAHVIFEERRTGVTA